MQYFIGCSGFYNNDWKGNFYPDTLPRKDWLHFYAQHFNSIEINSSFYRDPSLKSLQNWYQQTPDNFLFSLKAPRVITHYKHFSGTEQQLSTFYKHAQQGLKEKLGCILFQLPPSLQYSPGHLQSIIHAVDGSFRNAVEFRHISWWQQEVFEQLAARQIIFCGIDHPSTLSITPISNAGWIYYRFHGNPVLYKSLYSADKLKTVVSAVRQEKKNAFIFFNNTWGNAALHNARAMQQLIG